jgi:hypothetical protein
LITSCHVSEYPNIGPTDAHTMITATAMAKAPVLPAHLVTASDSFSNVSPIFQSCFLFITFPHDQFRQLCNVLNQQFQRDISELTVTVWDG